MASTAPGAVAALQAALAAEDAAIFGYGVAGAHLTGNRQDLAEQDWTSHNEARDALAAMITALGATPAAAQAYYELPFGVRDAATARELAAYLEDGVARAYLGIVAVSDQRLRDFGALAMQGPAQRAAYWRGRTQAFPGLTTGLFSGPRSPARGTESAARSQSWCRNEARTRTIVVAARSTSSATAIRSAHDHQNHHMPSLPKPA
jgi:hypothetical protein